MNWIGLPASFCWYHCSSALKHLLSIDMSAQPQPLSWMESNASPGALVMPAGAAPASNEVPLQPQPFMSNPQDPAGTSASLAGLRYFGFSGGCTRWTGPVPRQDPRHICRCPVTG